MGRPQRRKASSSARIWGRMTIDLGPAGWIDQKAEHVLLPAVKPSAAVRGFLGRLEVSRTVADQVQKVQIPQPRVADAVDRADRALSRKELKGLVAAGHRLRE